MHATLNYDGHSTTGSFIVVKLGTALLGLGFFVALHMCIEGTKVVTVTGPNDPPTVQRAPTVPCTTPQNTPEIETQAIESAKRFVHKIHLKPDAVPVQQRLKRLLFSVRQAVTHCICVLTSES